MLNLTHYQRSKNGNHNEVPSCWSEWLPSKSLQTINAGEGVEKRKPFYTVGRNANIPPLCKHSPLWRTVWRFLQNLETELPYDPAIPLLGIHTEETRTERDTCTPVFIAAMVTTARTWKQLICPLADEWIRKLWYTYTMEYYSAVKKTHLSQF